MRPQPGTSRPRLIATLVATTVIALTTAGCTAFRGNSSLFRGNSSLTIETTVTTGKGKTACLASAVCLYENGNFNESGNAQILITSTSIKNLGDYGFDNKASSAVNNSASDYAYIYTDTDYAGNELAVIKPTETPDWTGTRNDNKASSLRIERP
ncbi:peptidase inhibitor family I36 protein [Streptomyces sp. NPDC057654]|uniref:peptidase inhibitor family I36 protein n=1 Tax=Streptomyces sp. NPDC057654 TaxID=3346196 RepID=UPI0036AF1C16